MADRFTLSVLFKFPSPLVLQLKFKIRLTVDMPKPVNLRFSKQLCKVYMNHLIRHDGRQPLSPWLWVGLGRESVQGGPC